MANLNITNIPAPRVPFVDERTGLMAREWYRFFLNLFVLTGSGNNPITLEELQIGPPNQPDLTELLIQINQNIAPQYEDQSGDFLATLDTAQLMSMMSRFENAEAAIQGAYLQPVVQTGTIANYNLDGSPTAGGIVYGTGPALAVSAAGTVGQVLTSAGAGTPTWATAATGTVTSVTGTAPVVSSGGTTPAISMPAATTSVNGYLTSADWNTFNGKGSGTVTSVSGTAGRITSTGGATPVIDLVSGIATPGTTGSVSLIPVVTIDTYGRVTSITTAANPQGTVTSVTGTAPDVSSGGATPAISMAAATTSVNGYLTSADWTTFNNKQPAGSYIVNGGALGTPSSGSVTNLTGTASININGTVGVTTANTGFFTTLSATGLISFGNRSFQNGTGRISVTGATTIWSIVSGGSSVGASVALVLANGYNTASSTNSFVDLVLFIPNGTPAVISSINRGAPAVRTWTVSGNSLRLAMASGTYNVASAITEQAC